MLTYLTVSVYIKIIIQLSVARQRWIFTTLTHLYFGELLFIIDIVVNIVLNFAIKQLLWLLLLLMNYY